MHTTSRRSFLKTGAALGLGASAAAAARTVQAAAPQAPRRNILFILTDDQRFDALGMLNPYYTTPRLDALAQNGVLCENAFVTTALCSPSRASILSGQYAHTHGVLDNETPLPDDTPIFPVVLQQAGYRTGFMGKWHMGGSSDAPRPGFDRWVSFRGQGPYNDPLFNVDGEHVQTKGYTTDLITDYALEFLRENKNGPFCLYVSHKAVHAMFEPPPRHAGQYANREYPRPASMADTEDNYAGKPEWVKDQRHSWHGVDAMYNGEMDFDTFVQQYAETLLGVDENVGRLVDALEEMGLLESTLIVFAGDNGFLFGEHGLIDKRCMYEPSIRVPLIVHCPELFPEPQRRSEMILNIDFAPTFLDAAGLPVPDTMQGRSFLPLLTDQSDEWRDEFLYTYFWERAFPQTPTVLGVRTDRYKFMKFQGVWDKYELYDIQDDPHEMNNLLGQFIQHGEAGQLDGLIMREADAETKAVFADMQKRLAGLLKQYGCADEPNWRT